MVAGVTSDFAEGHGHPFCNGRAERSCANDTSIGWYKLFLIAYTQTQGQTRIPARGWSPLPKMGTVAIMDEDLSRFVCSVNISYGTTIATEQSGGNPSG